MRATMQLLKDIDRIEGSPLQNSSTFESLPDKLVSSEGLAEVRRLLVEIESRTTNGILVIEYSFTEIENALSDAEVSAADLEIVTRKSESVQATKLSIDLRYAAYMELAAALDQLAVFFETNLGQVKKSSNAFVFSTKAQYSEYSKIIARFNAADARVRELGDDSINKLGKMKDTIAT
jgi:hypothetical protein